jgi:hypothetical protein
MMRIAYITGALLIGQLTMGQKWVPATSEEIDGFHQKMETAYNQDSYGFAIRHASYKGHDAMKPEDEQLGYFYKAGNRFHSKVMGVETIQDEKVVVSILPSEKGIYLTAPEKDLVRHFTAMEKEQIMDWIASTEKMKEGSTTWMRYNYKKDLPLEKVEVQTNKQGFVLALKMYYATALPWEDEEGEEHETKPRLEIHYTKVDSETLANGALSVSHMVRETPQGYAPSTRFKDYEVYDMRVSN